MDRASLFYGVQNESTFSFDETLPALPLPELRDTMKRYYASLQPFGTPEELAHSRRIIDEFANGIGAELQAKLKERAAKMKNWLGSWWEDYAYHMMRLPLLPYQIMSMPCQMVHVGVPERPDYMLKVSPRRKADISIEMDQKY